MTDTTTTKKRVNTVLLQCKCSRHERRDKKASRAKTKAADRNTRAYTE